MSAYFSCIEWLLAVIAFSCCVNFSTDVSYTVTCLNKQNVSVKHSVEYPFNHPEHVNVTW
jgi:hypothetical protein